MATRRRVNTTNQKPALSHVPDGAWEDFSSAAPDLTHEEMLEVAEEREQVSEMLDVLAEEAFENLGEQDFFDPSAAAAEPDPQPGPVVHLPPAIATGAKLLKVPSRGTERTNRGVPKNYKRS